MNGLKKLRFVPFVLLVLGLVAAGVWYVRRHAVAVLQPAGPVGHNERTLMFVALLLSVLVVVPVFTMLFWFAWRYRASNTKATYRPDADRNRVLETIWWLLPTLLIGILSVIIWNSSHQLDPYKPLASNKQQLTIQVVALDWKWLFIYPQQGMASLNEVHFPAGTPVKFVITADAPMNSFWIPQLGGQVYAMPGMTTQLHLMASRNGSFNGSSANISGAGFSGMHFIAKTSSQADFDQWVQAAQQAPNDLNQVTYDGLTKPSNDDPVAYYKSPASGLYNAIVMKYIMPMDSTGTMGAE